MKADSEQLNKLSEHLLTQLLSTLPACIIIFEVKTPFEIQLYWTNNKLCQELGLPIDKHYNSERWFKSLFPTHEYSEIEKVFHRLSNKTSTSESMIIRVRMNHSEKLCYMRSLRIGIEPRKIHLLNIIFHIEEELVNTPEKIEFYLTQKQRLKNNLKISKLSNSEARVLNLLCKGLTTKDIARTLKRSFNTINNHRRAIFKKLNLHKISDVITFAQSNGLNSSFQDLSSQK